MRDLGSFGGSLVPCGLCVSLACRSFILKRWVTCSCSQGRVDKFWVRWRFASCRSFPLYLLNTASKCSCLFLWASPVRRGMRAIAICTAGLVARSTVLVAVVSRTYLASKFSPAVLGDVPMSLTFEALRSRSNVFCDREAMKSKKHASWQRGTCLEFQDDGASATFNDGLVFIS